MSAKQGSGYVYSQQVYDAICTIYYDTLLPYNEHTQSVLNRLSSLGYFKPHSRVLEVGCGPGKPITAYFSENGHDITAVDASTGMLNVARQNAPKAKLVQADLTSWEPSSESGIEIPCYDIIIASHCLYSMSVSQIRSLFYKFTRWVKKDGIIIIGMSYNQGNLTKNDRQFDERGWVEGLTIDFLGYKFDDSSHGREDAWVDLIKSTGLEIVDVDRTVLFRPGVSDPDMQFYITAKKVQDNSFFGPFPVPHSISGCTPAKFQVGAWAELREKLDTFQLKEAILKALIRAPKCHKVLSVSGQITPIVEESSVGIQQVSDVPSLDVQPASVDGVVLGDGALYTAPSPGDYLDHATQAITSAGPAKIIIVECAPDNELMNMLKDASKGLDIPFLHHGHLLQEADKKCKTRGFKKIEYLHTQCTLNFGALEGEERIVSAARLLSRACTDNADVQAELEGRLKELLKVQFLFRPLGEIFAQMVVLIAEREVSSQ